MKKSVLLLFVLFVGILIGSISTAFASVGETVEAVFSKFVFVVNGEQKELTADPLVYQGSTYLPVRVVSNLLGYDVTYKADEKTIELKSAPTENSVSKGSDSVSALMIEGKDIEEQIQDITNQIENAKYIIMLSERTLDTIRSENMGEKLENDTLDWIEQNKKLISQLEAQKAELEAQLQP